MQVPNPKLKLDTTTPLTHMYTHTHAGSNRAHTAVARALLMVPQRDVQLGARLVLSRARCYSLVGLDKRVGIRIAGVAGTVTAIARWWRMRRRWGREHRPPSPWA